MGNGHPLDTDPLNQQTTPMNREPGITVTHEDLQWVLTAITTPLGGLHLYKDCHQRPGQVQLAAKSLHGVRSDEAVDAQALVVLEFLDGKLGLAAEDPIGRPRRVPGARE